MGFVFAWDNDQKTVMRYTAEGDWNWNDYHKCVRMSLFSFHHIDHAVDIIVDLRRSSSLPAGARAHIRSVGKKLHESLSGRAIIIGVDEADALSLGATNGILEVGEQTVHFVPDNNAAQKLIAAWAAA